MRNNSRRFLGDLNDNFIFILIGISIVLFIGFSVYAGIQSQKSCEAQGGVYESDGECSVNGEDLYELD